MDAPKSKKPGFFTKSFAAAMRSGKKPGFWLPFQAVRRRKPGRSHRTIRRRKPGRSHRT